MRKRILREVPLSVAFTPQLAVIVQEAIVGVVLIIIVGRSETQLLRLGMMLINIR